MPRRASLYISAVVVTGLGCLVLAATRFGDVHGHRLVVTALLAVGVLCGEFAAIKVRRSGATGEITPSTTFLYALLLIAGPAGVVLNALASVIADVVRRKAPVKIAFNAAQY